MNSKRVVEVDEWSRRPATRRSTASHHDQPSSPCSDSGSLAKRSVICLYFMKDSTDSPSVGNTDTTLFPPIMERTYPIQRLGHDLHDEGDRRCIGGGIRSLSAADWVCYDFAGGLPRPRISAPIHDLIRERRGSKGGYDPFGSSGPYQRKLTLPAWAGELSA
jgi:hypothetical protein